MLEFHRHAQFQITTPQRVIRIMHYTLRHILLTKELTGGISDNPHNPDNGTVILTRTSLNTLFVIIRMYKINLINKQTNKQIINMGKPDSYNTKELLTKIQIYIHR